MAVGERDPYTGYMTTGHEWNGIKELNTPVPRPVYFFLIVTALFSVIYWVLMPTWPLGVTYTKGLLGIDQRNIVTESLKQAALDSVGMGPGVEEVPGQSLGEAAPNRSLQGVVPAVVLLGSDGYVAKKWIGPVAQKRVDGIRAVRARDVDLVVADISCGDGGGLAELIFRG